MPQATSPSKDLETSRRLQNFLEQHDATPQVERMLGLLFLILAFVIVLPIPFGNMLPAIAIFVISLGMIEKDGAIIVGGVVGACLMLVLMASAIGSFFSLASGFLSKK